MCVCIYIRVSHNGSDWGDPTPYHIHENLADPPTDWHVAPSILPPKLCCCNFHAIFGDFGQNCSPTKGPLPGNPVIYMYMYMYT